MAGKLRLVIVTPEGKTFDDDVEQVVMPGVEGQLGVLPGHVPLLTQIMPGELDLKAHSKGDELAVGGGFAEITGSRVTILTDMAVKPEDKLTVYRARKIQRFLSQPFHVAEVFTGTKGEYVPVKDTIKGFKEILEGKHDDVPEANFYMKGGISAVAKS